MCYISLPLLNSKLLKKERKFMNRNYVSIEFVAEFYGVSQRTIRNWISDGTLNGYELGPRLIRLDFDEIENLPVRIHGEYRRGRLGRNN